MLTVLQRKPISVGIAAENFQFYKSGIFDSSNRDINHAVVLIGYSKEYKAYKIKNSWGESGENGFAWIDLNKNAGICERAVVPYIQ